MSGQALGAYGVKRTAADTIEIDNPLGMNAGTFATVGRNHGYAVGETNRGSGFVAEVLELAPSGLPSRVRFTFSDPLADQQWMVWSDAGFVEVPIYALGERHSYEGVDLMTAAQRAKRP